MRVLVVSAYGEDRALALPTAGGYLVAVAMARWDRQWREPLS